MNLALDELTGNYSARGKSIKFINRSPYTIDRFYLSPASKSKWGQDWLAESVLPRDYSLTVKVNCGTYDVMTIDEDGLECVEYNVKICDLTIRELVDCD